MRGIIMTQATTRRRNLHLGERVTHSLGSCLSFISGHDGFFVRLGQRRHSRGIREGFRVIGQPGRVSAGSLSRRHVAADKHPRIAVC